MFDDVKKDDQNITSGTIPTDDMFGDVDPVKSGIGKREAGAGTSMQSALGSGKIRPVGQTPGVVEPQSKAARFDNAGVGPVKPLQSLDQATDWEKESKGSTLRKIFSIVVIIAVVAAVAFGGWFVYTSIIIPAMNKRAENANTNQPANTNVIETNINVNRNDVLPEAPPTIDQDGDGLTDVEEATLGTDVYGEDSDKDGLTDREEVKIYLTDPLNPDSDNDGLNDSEEIKIWHSDPMKPDTDGDTYPDGEEVANGYNPVGPGKLVPVEALPTQ